MNRVCFSSVSHASLELCRRSSALVEASDEVLFMLATSLLGADLLHKMIPNYLLIATAIEHDFHKKFAISFVVSSSGMGIDVILSACLMIAIEFSTSPLRATLCAIQDLTPLLRCEIDLFLSSARSEHLVFSDQQPCWHCS